MNFYLNREVHTEECTLGTLVSHGFVLDSLERPWLDNEPFVSCIPTGIYTCERSWLNHKSSKYPHGYECFEVMDVPERTHIKLHIANYPHQIQGCIAYGKSKDFEVPAVWKSGQAHREFMEYCQDVDEFELEVRDI